MTNPYIRREGEARRAYVEALRQSVAAMVPIRCYCDAPLCYEIPEAKRLVLILESKTGVSGLRPARGRVSIQCKCGLYTYGEDGEIKTKGLDYDPLNPYNDERVWFVFNNNYVAIVTARRQGCTG